MSNSLAMQKKLIEEKKREILMKTSQKTKPPEAASQSSPSCPTQTQQSGPSIFANDGNFLARFLAMQKQETDPTKETSAENKTGKVMMTLSNSKKKDKTKFLPAANNPNSAFEKPSPASADEDYEKIKDDANQIQAAAFKNASQTRVPVGAYDNMDSTTILGKRKRKNRWDEKATEESPSSVSAISMQALASASSSSLGSSNAKEASSSSSGPVDIMEEFQRAKALIQQKAAQAKSTSTAQNQEQLRQIQEQKEIEAMYRRIIEQQAAEGKKNASRRGDKPRYEYDSDEETEGGTWEHKKRLKEMEKTQNDALKLTDMGKGKHHMSDFLPKEELAKFEEKVRAIKEGRKADLSDYAEFKIKDDNIGFKMLQKAGWEEGKGLGSVGQGITEPINKGQTSFDNSGVGVEKPHEVEKHDDEYDIYRKRMMLAYRFRPNPLNNPRRPYY